MSIPIADKISLGALIEGFATYARTARQALRHPIQFVDTLELAGEGPFRQAMSFLLYSIALLFFLLVPVFAGHSTEVSKVTFAIRYSVLFLLWAVLLHAALRILGGERRTFKETAVVYAYAAGITTPLFVLFHYPVYLDFGPTALFGQMEDFIRLSEYYDRHPGLHAYTIAVAWVLGAFVIWLTTSWFSRTHKIGRFRVFVAMMLAGVVGGVVQMLVLNPVFGLVFGHLERWLKYA